MSSTLLATKLRIPPPTHPLVHRARLFDALERAIPDSTLVLVAAPAGYGKTTLLIQWAHESHFSIGWLTVGEDDSHFERFFRYLLKAWAAVQPGIDESSLGLLLGAAESDADAILSAFINVANELTDHLVFVLDNADLITEPSIHQALTFLLDHSPPTLHFVLAGREEPPLPLARYRAHHKLLEFRAEDLHFTPDETEEFLIRLMELDLNDDEVGSLQSQLEGWIAGLQLAALTLRRHHDPTEPLVISGRHRFIADYLSQDVLTHLPESRLRFLLQTSILESLSGPLCDAVTGGDDGQAMLESLERDNVFIVPLDDRREWFRYHRLFANFLQVQLNLRYPEEVTSLHRRAARWCLTHDLPEQGIHHAVAANDSALAVQFGERYFEIKLLSGEYTVLAQWLDSLPKQWEVDYPQIGLIRVGVLLFTGALEAGIRYLDEVERGIALVDRDDRLPQQARVNAIRCTIACFQNDLVQAQAYADSALHDLPTDDHIFRSAIHHSLGDTYRRNGLWQEAKAHYLIVLDLILEPAYRIRSVHAFGALADLELQQGRLGTSAAYWRRAIAIIQEESMWGSIPLPLIGWVFIRLGEILYEWNELTEAKSLVFQGLERSELSGDVRAMIAGYLMASRLSLADGEVNAASAFLDRARPLIEGSQFPDCTGHFERCQLDLWLAQDRLRTAVGWADAMLEKEIAAEQPEDEITELAIARMLIIKGDSPSHLRAIALLSRLIQTSAAAGQMEIQIEALALQALANWGRGNRAGAMTALERALRMAEPEGYVRLFVDLGLSMGRLLQEARSRDVMPDYVGKLLAAWGDDPAFPAGTLPEPLSPREQQVLALIAAGLSNSEIAEELVIAPETVKKHAANIYGKLGVGHRTEAVARARALHILD